MAVSCKLYDKMPLTRYFPQPLNLLGYLSLSRDVQVLEKCANEMNQTKQVEYLRQKLQNKQNRAENQRVTGPFSSELHSALNSTTHFHNVVVKHLMFFSLTFRFFSCFQRRFAYSSSSSVATSPLDLSFSRCFAAHFDAVQFFRIISVYSMKL